MAAPNEPTPDRGHPCPRSCTAAGTAAFSIGLCAKRTHREQGVPLPGSRDGIIASLVVLHEKKRAPFMSAQMSVGDRVTG